jgi:hypothetical protein
VLQSQLAWLSAYIFAGAPRYHTGGIAGLQLGEIPAILQRGETILPKDTSPSGNPVNVTVNISEYQHTGCWQFPRQPRTDRGPGSAKFPLSKSGSKPGDVCALALQSSILMTLLQMTFPVSRSDLGSERTFGRPPETASMSFDPVRSMLCSHISGKIVDPIAKPICFI